MSQHETKSCSRCNTPFECKVGNITQCQCYGLGLNDEDKAFLAANYTDCLCRDCLLAIKKEVKHKPTLDKIEFLRSVSKTR